MEIKVGDTLTRLLGGTVPHVGQVTAIDGANDQFIFAGMWTFRLSTGAEIDEDLGWDGRTITGSYIKEFHPNAKQS